MAFDCGVPVLNSYLQQYARQDLERGVATPYVLVPSTNPIEIAGFYTLTATAVKLPAFPGATIQRPPKYPLFPAPPLRRPAARLQYRNTRFCPYLLLATLDRHPQARRA